MDNLLDDIQSVCARPPFTSFACSALRKAWKPNVVKQSAAVILRDGVAQTLVCKTGSYIIEAIVMSHGNLVSVCFDLTELDICCPVLQTCGRYNIL